MQYREGKQIRSTDTNERSWRPAYFFEEQLTQQYCGREDIGRGQVQAAGLWKSLLNPLIISIDFSLPNRVFPAGMRSGTGFSHTPSTQFYLFTKPF
eukprot:1057244-Pelagomonas_calceolata.AAC.1